MQKLASARELPLQYKKAIAKYKIKNPIKGVILNDAFGLNIYQYLKIQINTDDEYVPGFLKVFTDKEVEWEKASPIFKVNNIKNPYIMFVGSKTYESILVQTPAFYEELKSKITISESRNTKVFFYDLVKILIGLNPKIKIRNHS